MVWGMDNTLTVGLQGCGQPVTCVPCGHNKGPSSEQEPSYQSPVPKQTPQYLRVSGGDCLYMSNRHVSF